MKRAARVLLIVLALALAACNWGGGSTCDDACVGATAWAEQREAMGLPETPQP